MFAVYLLTDDNKFEVEVNSDLNSEIQKLNIENYHRQLQQLIDDILDQKVAKTDMKLRHIVSKGIEVWLDTFDTISVYTVAMILLQKLVNDTVNYVIKGR